MPIKKRFTRKHASVLPWMRAVAFAALVLAGLSAMPFYPHVLSPVLAVGTGILAIFAPAISVLAVIVMFSLPLMASNLGVGLAFLVIGLSCLQYLGQDGARVFLIVGLAFVASLYNAGWAIVVIAGYALGVGEGALAALLACLVVEGAGLVFGREALGVIATGGTHPGLVSFADVTPGTVVIAGEPYSSLELTWVGPAFREMDVPALIRDLTAVRDLPVLIGQLIAWVAASAVTGALTRSVGDPKRRLMGFVAVGIGVATLTGVSAALTSAVSGPVPIPSMTGAGFASFGIAAAFVALSEFVFSPTLAKERRGSPHLRAEAADVDELLRVIASTEGGLAAKHTIMTTVLITDMKSFSAMPEAEGVVLTAEVIQRHRDLLLPIISRHHGSGRSTGGDGLLAAFDRPEDAVLAAMEMQRALDRSVRDHPDEMNVSVRMGIASGEVMVDTHGRPFTGDALDRAARTMYLADGGQIYATREVMDAVPSPLPVVDHGLHEVKNIQDALGITEVLWASAQEANAPRTTGPAVRDVRPERTL